MSGTVITKNAVFTLILTVYLLIPDHCGSTIVPQVSHEIYTVESAPHRATDPNEYSGFRLSFG